MSFLWIAFAAAGLAVFALVLVECARVLRSVRRCAVGTKAQWKAAIRTWMAANRALRSARRAARKGPATRMTVVIEKEQDVETAHQEARNAGDAIRKGVDEHAVELRKRREKPLSEATAGLKKFSMRLTELALAEVTSAKVLGIAGPPLLMVLTLIQIRYYAHFEFNVQGYLSGYSAADLVLSLLQALVVLLSAFGAVIVAIAFVLPWSVLQLIRIFDRRRAAVASALADSFFALSYRSTKWSRLALLLLGDTSAAPASEPGGAGEDGRFSRPSDDTPPNPATELGGAAENRPFRRLVEPAIDITGRCGSKLIRKGADGTATSLSSFSWVSATIVFLLVCAGSIWFEPPYRAYSTCHGTRATRVILDPPLRGIDSFTKIGQIGAHVFIVPFDECGPAGESRAAEAEESGTAEHATAGDDESGTEENGSGSGATGETDDSGGDAAGIATDESAVPGFTNFADRTLDVVFGSIGDRLDFLSKFNHVLIRPGGSSKSLKLPTDVAVVPVGRVLCMYEGRGDGKEPGICGPPPRHDEGTGISLVYRQTDNTWVLIVSSEVPIESDDEWQVDERQVKGEIEEKLCGGRAAISSEPILFGRGDAALADEQRAQEVIKAFLGKPKLQGANLHALGLASGDGDHRYNKNLSTRRAEVVVAEVKKLGGREPTKASWGENHLTNGVANSRSVRLIGCLPEAEAAGDGADETNQ